MLFKYQTVSTLQQLQVDVKRSLYSQFSQISYHSACLVFSPRPRVCASRILQIQLRKELQCQLPSKSQKTSFFAFFFKLGGYFFHDVIFQYRDFSPPHTHTLLLSSSPFSPQNFFPVLLQQYSASTAVTVQHSAVYMYHGIVGMGSGRKFQYRIVKIYLKITFGVLPLFRRREEMISQFPQCSSSMRLYVYTY